MRALAIAASGGIGAALAARWTAHWAEVVALSRRADGLDRRGPADTGRFVDWKGETVPW